MAGVAAVLTGNDVNVAATTAGNAAENNYLTHAEANTLLKNISACNGDKSNCINPVIQAANNLSNSRNAMDLLNPVLAQDVAAGSATLNAAANTPGTSFTVSGGICNLIGINNDQQATANAVPVLSAPPTSQNPYYSTFQSDLSGSLTSAGVIATPLFMAAQGAVGALASVTVTAASSYQFGQGAAAVNDGQYVTGGLNIGLGALGIFGGVVGVTSALGTTAIADVASVDAYAGLSNPSGNTNTAANSARNQYYGNGGSASPSPGTATAGSSGSSVNTGLTSSPDFYVNSQGATLPATGYRYMDSQYAAQTQSTMTAPLSYFGFTDYPTGAAARNGYQIFYENGNAASWSDASLKGEFNTLQLFGANGFVNAKVPLTNGGIGPGLEPYTISYPQYGVGGQAQLVPAIPGTIVQLNKITILPKK
jgi:hypothetical protein